jgi:hypothetical protein
MSSLKQLLVLKQCNLRKTNYGVIKIHQLQRPTFIDFLSSTKPLSRAVLNINTTLNIVWIGLCDISGQHAARVIFS